MPRILKCGLMLSSCIVLCFAATSPVIVAPGSKYTLCKTGIYEIGFTKPRMEAFVWKDACVVRILRLQRISGLSNTRVIIPHFLLMLLQPLCCQIQRIKKEKCVQKTVCELLCSFTNSVFFLFTVTCPILYIPSVFSFVNVLSSIII